MLNKKGDLCSGDFRADHMEGKLTYLRTLPKSETEKIIAMFVAHNDIFIMVPKGENSLSTGA